MMRHRQERKYSITINCFDISISEVYELIHSKCTCMYPVKRGSLDSVHVCGSQQFAQLFLGDVYGISKLIWKIGVEVDKQEKLLTLSLLSAKGPQHRERWAVLYLSSKPVKIRFGNKIAFSENENVKVLWKMNGG